MVAICRTSILKVPIFGFLAKLGGCIFVDKNDTNAAINALNDGVYELREIPKSVLVFPEGKIPIDNGVHQFKQGVFIFAIQTGMPIVPIAIQGCRDVFGRDFSIFHKIRPGCINVVIGEPICTRNMFAYGYDKRKLCALVHKQISDMYDANMQPEYNCLQ
jgi:1-acyl-sn-glycerol-3-phosphate acyltransferase